MGHLAAQPACCFRCLQRRDEQRYHIASLPAEGRKQRFDRREVGGDQIGPVKDDCDTLTPGLCRGLCHGQRRTG